MPYRLREQILDFATFVEDAAEDLLQSAGVPEASDDLVDQLVYIAGMWRLWQAINGQVSLLDNSLALLQTGGVEGVQMGRRVYTDRSPEREMLIELRETFTVTLMSQDLGYVTSGRSLPDLVRSVVRNYGR